jgi:ribonucleoside-diphosphate reductase alpha chain
MAEHRSRRDGFAGRLLPDAHRVRFEAARKTSAKIQEEIYFGALNASADLAATKGAHPAFPETRAANGDLQFDLWGVVPEDRTRWNELREKIKATGLRNSLMIAIAPTATIASIAGCYECIEPQVSNLFKRETLSGDFVQVNKYLVQELQEAGLWTDEIRNKIKLSEGSVQEIEEFDDELKAIYRTAWEIPMRSLIDMAAGPRCVHRPECVAQSVHGKSEHRQTLVDVHVRMAERIEDDLLPAFATGDEDLAGDG